MNQPDGISAGQSNATSMEPRPGLVTALGWLYTAGAVAGLFAGGSVLGLGRQTRAMTKLIPMEEITKNAPPSVGAMIRFFESADVLLIAQMSLCSFTIICAAYFLQRRAWARMGLEGVTWFSMGMGFVAAAAAIHVTQDMASYMELSVSAEARKSAPLTPAELRMYLTGAIAGLTLVNTAVAGLFIYLLRRPHVRGAMVS